MYRVRGVDESVVNIEGLSILFTEKCVESDVVEESVINIEGLSILFTEKCIESEV